jgi:hypothetical protein
MLRRPELLPPNAPAPDPSLLSTARAWPELHAAEAPSSAVAGLPLRRWRRRGEIRCGGSRLTSSPPRQLDSVLVTVRDRQCAVVPSNLPHLWRGGRSTTLRACGDTAAAAFSSPGAVLFELDEEGQERRRRWGRREQMRRRDGCRGAVTGSGGALPFRFDAGREVVGRAAWWARLSLEETLHRSKSGGGGRATPFSSGF